MKKIATALLLSAAISAPAFAANEGAYVAVDLGQASFSNANGGPNGTTAFPNPGSLRIGGGYHFSQYVGVEAGYSIIGDSTINSTITGVGTATETLKTKSLNVAAVGTYPINDMFNVFGKLGLANTKIDYTLTSNFGATGSASASKTNLMFGLGGQYNINQHFGIRAQYEDFGKVQFAGTGPNVGVKVISVGGVYNF